MRRYLLPIFSALAIAGTLLTLLPKHEVSAQSAAEPMAAEDALAISADESLPFAQRLAAAAVARTHERIRYDPAYVVLDYPGGDVPADTGVCTDVVVRSFRTLGIDLQKRVHEDMRANFGLYPDRWGLKKADRNIDHRRVPNLQTFFARFGEELEGSDDPDDYHPGDLVAYDLNGRGLVHIAIVVAPTSAPDERWIVHNIGGGPKLRDSLLAWEVIGHYRYAGE